MQSDRWDIIMDFGSMDFLHEAVPRAAITLGLSEKFIGSLARYPGSLHWHLSFKGKPGTLEVTALPAGAAWVSLRSNRVGDIPPGLGGTLAAAISGEISSHPSSPP